MSSAAIEALRQRGAHRLDPIRFRVIEALARRAMDHEGEARRVIDSRLAALLAACSDRFEAGDALDHDPAPAAMHPRGPLADLLDHLNRHAEPPTELKTSRHFASTWSKLSVDRRLRQSLAKLPENAGPLHSHSLVLRSLESVRDISPPYLHRLMAYVDALLWLDQASGGSGPTQKDVVRADGDRKRKAGRGKSG